MQHTHQIKSVGLLARYGDIWNFNGWEEMDVEVFKHKLSVLERHCEDIGRDPAEIKLTVHYPLRHAETDAERERILQENPNRTVGSRNFPHRFDQGVCECGGRGDVLRHLLQCGRFAAGG